MANTSEMLIDNLRKLSDLEISKLEFTVATYLRRVSEKIKTSIEEISLRLDEEIEFYGQKPENYSDYKGKIIEKYELEFASIEREYELQLINCIEELQQTQSNQKLAIANCKRIYNLRQEYLQSNKYENYKMMKSQYKHNLDNSLTKEDFDKNLKLLDELKDPIEQFDIKVKASLKRAKDYDTIIEKCYMKIDEVYSDIIEKLNELVAQKTKQLQIYSSTNIITKIIKRISNIFSGKKKLQIEVIDKMEIELEELENRVNESNNETKNNTISFIESILSSRKNLDENYKKAVNGEI